MSKPPPSIFPRIHNYHRGWVSVTEKPPGCVVVLTYNYHDFGHYLAVWDDFRGVWFADNEVVIQPTHWMTLPPHPDRVGQSPP